MLETNIQAGRVVGATYQLTRKLGAGGMGEVWLAEHTRLPGLEVAVKFLFGGVVKADDFDRFQREAYIMASLHHPHITKVIDLNTLEDGSPYIVLEYLQGEPLSDRLERGELSAQELCHVIAQVGSALQATHSQEIIHRDLKPDNIFLCETPDGDLPHVKVLDFGVSKVRSPQKNITVQEQGFLGTPQYMSPEQALGNADVDQAADQFSLGIITYEMLTGYLPFGGELLIHIVSSIVHNDPIPLRELAPQWSAEVERVVHKALSKDKTKRYPSCNAFVSAFVKAMMDSEEPDDWDVQSLTEIIGEGEGGDAEGSDTLMMKAITPSSLMTGALGAVSPEGIEGDEHTKVDGAMTQSINHSALLKQVESPADELINQAITYSSLWGMSSAPMVKSPAQLKEWEASPRASLNQQDPLMRAQREAEPSLIPPSQRSPSKRPLMYALIALGALISLTLIFSAGQAQLSLGEVMKRIEATPRSSSLAPLETFPPYQALIQGVKLSTQRSEELSSPERLAQLSSERSFKVDAELGLELNAYITLSKEELKRLGVSHLKLRGAWIVGDEIKPSQLSLLNDASDKRSLTLYATQLIERAAPERWTFALTLERSDAEAPVVLIAPFELSPAPVKKTQRRERRPRKQLQNKKRRRRSASQKRRK